MNSKEKEYVNQIKSLVSQDNDTRRLASEALLKAQNEDWESCVKAAEILKESDKPKDKKALIQFAHVLFLHAKELSNQGTKEDVDIRRNEMKAYDKVLEINPKHSSCLNNQGITYMELQDWEHALECFEKALNGEPGYNPDLPITSSYYSEMLERVRTNKEIATRNLRQKIEFVSIEIHPEEIEKAEKKPNSIGERVIDIFHRIVKQDKTRNE